MDQRTFYRAEELLATIHNRQEDLKALEGDCVVRLTWSSSDYANDVHVSEDLWVRILSDVKQDLQRQIEAAKREFAEL